MYLDNNTSQREFILLKDEPNKIYSMIYPILIEHFWCHVTFKFRVTIIATGQDQSSSIGGCAYFNVTIYYY